MVRGDLERAHNGAHPRRLRYGGIAGQGVVGFNGEIYGYPNLYVADGSVVPANLAVNPSLTITALSEHIMSQVPSKAS